MFLPVFVCLCVCMCVQDNSKRCARIFLKFWGHVWHGIIYRWLNFGADPAGILDSGSLWNFRYHCVKGGIREPLAKRQCIQSQFFRSRRTRSLWKCNYSLKRVGEIYITIWQALGGGTCELWLLSSSRMFFRHDCIVNRGKCLIKTCLENQNLGSL